MYLLGNCVGFMSKTQGLLALSSGEAELYAIGYGVMETIFLRNFLREVNLSPRVPITIYTDSTAGKSMATRYGASRRTRHIELRYFYMQSVVVSGLVKIAKAGGSENVADLGTKYLDKATLSRLRDRVGVLPGLQLHDSVQLVVCGRLFERPEKPPQSPHRPPLPPGDRELPLYQPQDHIALCHYMLPLCRQPSHYREWNVRATLGVAMGNYNFNAAHVPQGQLPSAEQAFHYYLGLCVSAFTPEYYVQGVMQGLQMQINYSTTRARRSWDTS